MCCFARPMCLTFVEVKFMGKKKLFSFLEPLLFFNSGLCWCIFWSRIVTDREDGDIFWSQWWLQRQLWPFPQPSLSQNSFQAVIQSPLQIFNRNIKHLIISKERDAAWWPWKANMQARQGSLVHGWSKVQMFCAGAGGKTNTVLLCHHGKQLFGERQKIQNSSVCYMGEEICRRDNERGQQLHLKGRNTFRCPDILLKRGIFFWPAGWNIHVENSPLL